MAVLLGLNEISKSYRSRALFENLSLSIEDREKIGVIGPNGSGKSTLLKVMAELVEPDSGDVFTRKGVKVAYLAQEDRFDGETAGEVMAAAVRNLNIEGFERDYRAQKALTEAGFSDPSMPVDSMSGGWCKRLSIACKLVGQPDLLLLDEPTNHLDLDGVVWLQSLLINSGFSFVLVSHDRMFLESVSNRIIELNPAYEEGFLSVNGKYSDFLLAREEYLRAQAHLEQALASKVRREIAWLKQGAKARETKSKVRIQEAGKLMESLAEVKERNRQDSAVDIEFDASRRKTKELLAGKGLSKTLGGKLLFENLDVLLTPGTRLGLIGSNGSGKTTLMKVLSGRLEPDEGSVKAAEGLKVVWFDQDRAQLDQDISLKESLCFDGDSVCYRGRMIHVSSWAKRFCFDTQQLHLPVGYLSGGEQARILLAKLMVQPADILILDEPTNDLDIPSLEVLEESLVDFPGAVILVTHDRYMLNAVSNRILALDGFGGAAYYADYDQWESLREDPAEKPKKEKKNKADRQKRRSKGLTGSEKKDLSNMEEMIASAENEVKLLEASMEDPDVASNHVELQNLIEQLDEAKHRVETLYARWEELERKAGGANS